MFRELSPEDNKSDHVWKSGHEGADFHLESSEKAAQMLIPEVTPQPLGEDF